MLLQFFFLGLWSCWWSVCTHSDRVLTRGEEGVRWVLVSGVLVGGEGGEGGGRRERQRAGLRTDTSSRGRVCRRLRDTEGEEGRNKRERQEEEALFRIFYL